MRYGEPIPPRDLAKEVVLTAALVIGSVVVASLLLALPISPAGLLVASTVDAKVLEPRRRERLRDRRAAFLATLPTGCEMSDPASSAFMVWCPGRSVLNYSFRSGSGKVRKRRYVVVVDGRTYEVPDELVDRS